MTDLSEAPAPESPEPRRRFAPKSAREMIQPGEVPPPEWDAVKDVRATGASQVGGYALQFDFSDGHSTGIYAYDRLRDACPCDECRAARGGDPA